MRKMLLINMIVFILISIGNYFYILENTIWLSVLMSLLVLLLGILNGIYMIYKNKKNKCYSISIILALAFAVIGDLILEFDFIAGALMFTISHITFTVSYSFIERYEAIDSLTGSIIFTILGAFILYAECVKIPNLLTRWICMGYVLIVAVMVGKAISNFFRSKTLTNSIILIGSALFLVADCMLLVDLYVRTVPWAIKVCWGTFYPAEFLLAFSILVNGTKLKAKKK